MQELFSFDEEYLGIVLAQFLGIYMAQNVDWEIAQQKIKYNGMIMDAFDTLCYSASKDEFSRRVREWTAAIFGIHSSLFYFVEEPECLARYEQGKLPERFSLEHGIAGLVARQQKAYIVNDVHFSSLFNSLVDI
jgi:hypothetical protein